MVKNIWILSAVLASASTMAAPLEVGTYVNPAYGSQYGSWAKGYVNVREVDGALQLQVSIPCGTKLSPAILVARPDQDDSFYYSELELEVVVRGSSQCSLGDSPRFIVWRTKSVDVLEIRTNIRTPGFDGTYTFERVIAEEIQ